MFFFFLNTAYPNPQSERGCADLHMEIASRLMALTQLLCCSAREFLGLLAYYWPTMWCETAAFVIRVEHGFIGMQWSLCFSPPSNLLMPEQREIGFI